MDLYKGQSFESPEDDSSEEASSSPPALLLPEKAPSLPEQERAQEKADPTPSRHEARVAKPGKIVQRSWLERWLGGWDHQERAPDISFLGSKNSGKTYLFFSLLHRLRVDNLLLPFFGEHLSVKLFRDGVHVSLDTELERYKSYRRLPNTQKPEVYEVEVRYGRREGLSEPFRITYTDQKGENPQDLPEDQWMRILKAEGLVIAYPIFALAPRYDGFDFEGIPMSHTRQFAAWIDELCRRRDKYRASLPSRVDVVIAFTQADAPKSREVPGWKRLYDFWVDSYDESARAPWKVGRMISVQNEMNDRLREIIQHDSTLRPALNTLRHELGAEPRCVPVQSIEGEVLEQVSSGGLAPLEPPRPIYVEMPLLCLLSRSMNYAC